jgi:transcription antitermination factor NusG
LSRRKKLRRKNKRRQRYRASVAPMPPVPVMVKRPQPRFEVDPELTWYAVRIAIRMDDVARKGLKRWGFAHWRPLFVFDKIYPTGRVREVVRNPLVRYMLVGIGSEAREAARCACKHELYLLSGIIGIETIVGVAGLPAVIQPSELQQFADSLADEQHPVEPRRSFSVGHRASVKVGPFASFGGIVEEIDMEQLRAVIAVEIFGRTTPVEIEFADLQAA